MPAAGRGSVVALRKESVDRNVVDAIKKRLRPHVALRKESVDRNESLTGKQLDVFGVALRKESVDRNMRLTTEEAVAIRRSPQGERG